MPLRTMNSVALLLLLSLVGITLALPWSQKSGSEDVDTDMDTEERERREFEALRAELRNLDDQTAEDDMNAAQGYLKDEVGADEGPTEERQKRLLGLLAGLLGSLVGK